MVRVFGLTLLALLVPALAAPVPEDLEARQSGCADVMVVYARGTDQDSPIGDPASVGVLFRDNIKSLLGSRTFSFQGVNYAANVIGFLQGGDPAGSRQMTTDLTNVANSCPNAKIVSAGYSQGGQLVHNSAAQLTAAVRNRINAVVIFGDPKSDQAVTGIPSSNVKIICHDGDNICEGGFIVTSQHTNYQQDAPAAAQFVLSKV
ncbi:cutinase [Moniliophthora roreri MCA 2997]|uniref:cutinase n=2 Tax=Moniliophthora roreri TaxID=221103 RepID=V2XFA5_MONRO|nr:cutinase [Moniliophthora roreri MCA 2997]KAI3602630.1 cutinase [Moniliophthora roreri]